MASAVLRTAPRPRHRPDGTVWVPRATALACSTLPTRRSSAGRSTRCRPASRRFRRPSCCVRAERLARSGSRLEPDIADPLPSVEREFAVFPMPTRGIYARDRVSPRRQTRGPAPRTSRRQRGRGKFVKDRIGAARRRSTATSSSRRGHRRRQRRRLRRDARTAARESPAAATAWFAAASSATTATGTTGDGCSTGCTTERPGL